MKPRSKIAAAVAAAFIIASVGFGAQAAGATPLPMATGPAQCVVNVIHHDAVPATHIERRYSQLIPGHAATTHPEFQYSKVTTVYTVEHKMITPPSNASDKTKVYNWLVDLGSTDVDGDEWLIPDDVVNAAGVKVIGPGAVAQSGTVPLNAYEDGPHVPAPNASVHYEIIGIDITTTPPVGSLFVTNTNTTIYYVHGANPTATLTSANWTTDVPNGWTQIHTRDVSNNDAVPDKTVYYLPGGGQSNTLTAANWTTETPAAPWTFIDQRGTETTAVAAYDENVYGPCPTTPVTPVPPTVTQPVCTNGLVAAGSAPTFAELVALQPAGVVTTLNNGSTTDGTFAPAATYTFTNGSPTTFSLKLDPAPSAISCATSDSTASVTVDKTVTCDHGETLVYGNAVNASFATSSTPNGKSGPASYTVTANSNPGHKFNATDVVATFTGTLAGPLTGSICTVLAYTGQTLSNQGVIIASALLFVGLLGVLASTKPWKWRRMKAARHIAVK